jgi:hypothetical protein
LPESAELKQTEHKTGLKREKTQRKIKAAFAAQTMGIFVLLIIVLAFAAGAVRRELALTLIGAVFLAVWLYCLLMTLLLALFRRGRARQVSIRISPGEVSAGDSVELLFSYKGVTGNSAAQGKAVHGAKGRINFRLPGILIRCRLLLRTKDGRQISYDFDPDRQRRNSPHLPETVQANERGAYFSEYDEFAVFDALGFFRFAFRIPVESGKRLLVCPHPADDPPASSVRSGGTERPREFQLQRSDNLIDHRPYIPGDDPRRINWKLFGHGGELFVREGEPEPPPHSNVLILIDTQYDTLLYSANSGRRGVDLLCENALAVALGFAGAGMDVLIGYTGCASGSVGSAAKGGVTSNGTSADGVTNTGNYLRANTPAEFAAALAWPAGCPVSPESAELPPLTDERGVLIFALPRANAEPGALGRFLNQQKGSEGSPIEIIFLYAAKGRDEAALDEAAEICTAFYNRVPNARARQVKVMHE